MGVQEGELPFGRKAGNVVGVLSKGFEDHSLGGTISDADYIGIDDEGAVGNGGVGVDGYFCENVETVVWEDLEVFKVESGDAVHIESEGGVGVVFEIEMAYFDGLGVVVFDFEEAGGGTDLSEYSIEMEGVHSESQLSVGVGSEGVVFATAQYNGKG